MEPGSPAPMPDQDHILRDESDFIDNVSQFFNQEEISDVRLKVGSTTFFAHKFVLAKSSEVFRTMLYSKEWTHSGMPEVQLNESSECETYFDRFLKFLYTAKVNISVDSAVGILCWQTSMASVHWNTCAPSTWWSTPSLPKWETLSTGTPGPRLWTWKVWLSHVLRQLHGMHSPFFISLSGSAWTLILSATY